MSASTSGVRSGASRPRPRSHRFALVAAVAVFGLSACGTAGETAGGSATGSSTVSSLPSPAVIRVAGAGSVGGSAAPAADAAESTKMMVPMSVTYDWAGDPVDLTPAAASWFFAPGTAPTAERVQALAAAFGVTGDVTEVAADMGGGWMVGPGDGSAPSITVSTDSMHSWWYSPAWLNERYVDECASEPAVAVDPAVDPASDPAAGSGDTAASDAPAGTDSEVPLCEPQPPVGIPTAAAAEASAREVLAAAGVDVERYEFEVYADEWSASVSGFLVLDGVRSNLGVNVGFGENGAITWAGGFLASPERGADYPRIGVDAAIDRLNDQAAQWMTGYGAAMTDIARTDSVPAEAAPVESTEPADQPADQPAGDEIEAPVDSVVGDPFDCTDPAVSCLPEQPGDIDPADMEPIVFTLTGAEASLEQVWDVDGTIWLLPGYAFSGADGVIASVIAIEDEFLAPPVVDEVPMPEPAPTETDVAVDPSVSGSGGGTSGSSGSSGGVDGPWADLALVGLPLDEATAVAEQAGWSVRVIREDGVDLAVTMDFVDTRLNVATEAGVVTEVLSVG